MTAPARRRPTLPGRPPRSAHEGQQHSDTEGTEVVNLRDPQRIAGIAVAKYGAPLAHQIAAEMASLVDYVEHGPAFSKPIPPTFRETARRGIESCRAVLTEARQARIEAEARARRSTGRVVG